MEINKYIGYANHINSSEYVIKWINTTLSSYLEKHKLRTEEVEHVLDYLSSDKAPKRISKMSYVQARSATKRWNSALQKKGNHILESVEDTETILDFKDGFKIVKLIGENAYKREGYLMRNCVASYYGRDIEIYSLRDSNNMPHCTMEKDQQIKGKGNGDIHPKYVPYVVKFLEYTGMVVSDEEMAHLGYISIASVSRYTSPETKKLAYKGKYLPKDAELIDKTGEKFSSFDFLDQIPLIGEIGRSIAVNYSIPTYIPLAIEFLIKTIGRLKGGIKSSGYYAKIGSSGYYAKIGSSGYGAQIGSSGDSAKIEVKGQDSIASAIGMNSEARGIVGCWIVPAEYSEEGKVINVISGKVDGKKIKENIWYKCKNGKFTEVQNDN